MGALGALTYQMASEVSSRYYCERASVWLSTLVDLQRIG